MGWLVASSLDAPVVEGRHERDVYNVWAPGYRDRPANAAGKDVERVVFRLGGDVFIASLKDAGMTRFLGGSKVGQIGYLISGAGFLLHFIQSNLLGHDEFAEAAERFGRLIEEDSLSRGRWAWDNFGI